MAAAEQPFIDVSKLTYKTPVGRVYENVSFKVPKGKVCAVYGNSGNGKTQVLLAVSSRMKFTSGQATVDGMDLKSQGRKIRDLSQLSFFDQLNDVQPFLKLKSIAAAELALDGKHGNKPNTDAFLEKWHFADKADLRFNELDSYEKALFGIVLGMAAEPQVLCVDDIQTDLTQHESIKLMEKLKELAQATGVTVLVSLTEYAIARHADGIVVMSKRGEAQRRAVARDAGVSMEQACPVFGIGNNVECQLTGMPQLPAPTTETKEA